MLNQHAEDEEIVAAAPTSAVSEPEAVTTAAHDELLVNGMPLAAAAAVSSYSENRSVASGPAGPIATAKANGTSFYLSSGMYGQGNGSTARKHARRYPAGPSSRSGAGTGGGVGSGHGGELIVHVAAKSDSGGGGGGESGGKGIGGSDAGGGRRAGGQLTSVPDVAAGFSDRCGTFCLGARANWKGTTEL